jgi:hypothetical protein
MLLFVAPAVIFVPNVAAAEDVVQEVTATFTFSENATGAWSSFTAGSGGLEGTPPRLCLEQYTRDNVVIPNAAPPPTVPGCGYRNYTTGSGSVSGDLSGALSLAWLTFNFNTTYTHTPKYMTSNHFGFMMGRGHIGSTLTFVFVADFDANDATMSNAVGKGLMLSANETGAFAGHKIIGDFNITKTGTSYSGTFHLRNYAPNEVYDLSWLNVSGGVLQEKTDPISTPLVLLNYTADGPYTTPTNITTDFEEIDWGRDPLKTVTSGHLGVGGTMDLSRNTALYLELGGSWVRIQGTTACNLYIDDTNTGDREGDGSTYGKLYELLLLYIPNQKLDIGGFFFQNGYTFTPFGMLNPSTECYAGTESYALAGVAIESKVGIAQQWSVDHSYGLYPHPKVASVTPNTGSRGQTMNVTITGKYFLRADDFAPNSGSVSFGDGITVNSYTIMNSSPIDNEIEANITIDACAAGPRPVSVTSCFGYHSGSGIAPYKTGSLAAAFDVPVAGTAALEGTVSFPGRGAASQKWEEPFVVRFFNSTTGNVMACSPMNGITNETGVFGVYGVTPGAYNISIKNCTCLSEMVFNEAFTAGITNKINFGSSDLREGDCDENDVINMDDRDLLYMAWGTTNVIQAGYYIDLDRNGVINMDDRDLAYMNWGKIGDLYLYTH